MTENRSKPSQSSSCLSPDNCRYCKKLGHWKRNVLSLGEWKVWEITPLDPTILRKFIFLLLTGNFPPIDGVSQSSVSPQRLPLKFKIEDRELDFWIDTGATFSTIHSEDQSLPVTSDSIQAVGLSEQSISLSISQPTPISLGPLNTHHAYLVSNCSPANWLGRALLCKLNATIKHNKKGIFISLPSDQAPDVLLSLLGTHSDLNFSE